MGCDIHAIFQAKTDGIWVDVPSKYDEGRDYVLFSWLAGVRGSSDFQISKQRGLPNDFDLVDGYFHPILCFENTDDCGHIHVNGERARKYMGEHSHSWLTSTEILSEKNQLIDGDDIQYFIDEVSRMHKIYKEVRIIFGFDS